MVRFVTAEEMRTLDRRAVAEHGIPSPALMQRAGLGVASAVRRLALATGVRDLPIQMAAGHGNNGGDVFAAAAYLQAWGFHVSIRLAAQVGQVAGDAKLFLDALPADCLEAWPDSDRWDADDPARFPLGTLFVDGVLGTGARGAPRGAAAGAVRWLRRAAARGRIVAVDLPSGVDANAGTCSETHVVADLTVCLALPKIGLRSDEALAACGRVEIVDLGFPAALCGAAETDDWGWIGEPDVAALVPQRPRAAHKGSFGHVLVIGGARGYAGAPALAACGALRSGAGLTTVLTPRAVATEVAGHAPEIMVRAAGPEGTEFLSAASLGGQWDASLATYQAIVVGPGLSQRDGTAAVVEGVLASGTPSAVLDADALNLMAGHPERLRTARPRLVLTPHPGEAGRLLGSTAAAVQADRPAALRRLVELTQATVVLKGAGTLVGAPGRGIHRLAGGNPGMATGGSGDVLAGLIGGLLAQGLTPFDAARVGTWWHAAAGDLAAWESSEATLVAGDIVRCLGRAWRWLAPR